MVVQAQAIQLPNRVNRKERRSGLAGLAGGLAGGLGAAALGVAVIAGEGPAAGLSGGGGLLPVMLVLASDMRNPRLPQRGPGLAERPDHGERCSPCPGLVNTLQGAPDAGGAGSKPGANRPGAPGLGKRDVPGGDVPTSGKGGQDSSQKWEGKLGHP